MSELKMALAQLECMDGDLERNFAQVQDVVKSVGRQHDLVVFPESYLLGFPDPTTMRALAEPLNGPTVSRLIQLAQRYDTTLAIGVAEKTLQGIYNTSILVGAEGVLLAYRKIHLWVGENARVNPGHTVSSRPFQGLQVGLLICYDVEFPETARALASLGIDLIVLTNGNMAPYGDTHRIAIRARAQENQVFVAMANRVGPAKDVLYVGESCVVDPKGQVLGSLSAHDEGLLSLTIDSELVAKSRERYDYLKERRIGLAIPHPTASPNGICSIDVGSQLIS